MQLQAIQLVGVLLTKQEVMFRVVKPGWGYKWNIQADDTLGSQWLKLFQGSESTPNERRKKESSLGSLQMGYAGW